MCEPEHLDRRFRVYADTSTIGGREDVEVRGPSRRLIEQCVRGTMKLMVSSVAEGELATAPPAGQGMLAGPGDLPEVVDSTTIQISNRADRYIGSGALTETKSVGTDYIVVATVAEVKVLASWNFGNMVDNGECRVTIR